MRLAEPHPRSLSPRAVAIAGWTSFLVTGFIFLAIAWNVSAHAEIVVLDAKIAAWLHTHARPWLTDFFIVVTTIHSVAGTIALTVAFGAVLARLREWYWLLTLALAVGGGELVNVMLKYAYERARPHFDDPMVTLNTFSFPSGHTAGAVVFYGVLAAFVVSRYYGWRPRAASVGVAIIAVLLVAFSRMYLGAHYLSDVVAAACSSLAWLALCLSGVHALVRRQLKRPSAA